MKLNLDWITESIISLAAVIPCWLAIDFLKKNYGMKPEITVIWFSLMTSIGGYVFFSMFGFVTKKDLIPSLAPVIIIIVMGLVLGSTANILLFRAVVEAPNPGIPVAIGSTSSVFVFIFSIWLSLISPKYFNPVKFDAYDLSGVLLIIIIVGLIIYRH